MSSFLFGKPVKLDSDPGARTGVVAVHTDVKGCFLSIRWRRWHETKGLFLLCCSPSPDAIDPIHPNEQWIDIIDPYDSLLFQLPKRHLDGF